MKNTNNHEEEIQRLLNDKDFAKRTAAAVMARARQDSPRINGYWAAAAVAVLAAGALWFGIGEKQTVQESYAGLTETSASSVVQEAQSAWKDTDNIINASLVSQ